MRRTRRIIAATSTILACAPFGSLAGQALAHRASRAPAGTAPRIPAPSAPGTQARLKASSTRTGCPSRLNRSSPAASAPTTAARTPRPGRAPAQAQPRGPHEDALSSSGAKHAGADARDQPRGDDRRGPRHPLPEHRTDPEAGQHRARARGRPVPDQPRARPERRGAAAHQPAARTAPPKDTARNWSPTTTSPTSPPAATTPVDRIRATGYIPSPERRLRDRREPRLGHLSLSTPQAIVAAWIASPGHLANILEAAVHGHRDRRRARRARLARRRRSRAPPTRRSSASSST